MRSRPRRLKFLQGLGKARRIQALCSECRRKPCWPMVRRIKPQRQQSEAARAPSSCLCSVQAGEVVGEVAERRDDSRQAGVLDRKNVLDWNIPFALATVALNFSRLLFGVVPVGSKDLPKSSIAPAPSAAPTHANNATMNQI